MQFIVYTYMQFPTVPTFLPTRTHTLHFHQFICISSGLVEVTHEYASRKHDKLVAYCNECEALLRENNIELPLRKKKIDKLKRLDAPLESQASSDSLNE